MICRAPEQERKGTSQPVFLMIYSSMCMGFYYSFTSAFLYNFKMKE